MMKGSADDTKPKRPPNFVPRAALKRFAEDLKTSNHYSLDINRHRVTDFIDVPVKAPVFGPYKRNTDRKCTQDNVLSFAKKMGAYDYPEPSVNVRVGIQTLPEFQKGLGDRSRFGEGDGSFFDLWLTSDITRPSMLKLDRFGLPCMK